MSSAGILRYVAPRMARYAFDDPMAMSSSGGSWKSLFYFAAGGGGCRVCRVRLPVPVFENGTRGRRQPVGDRRRAPRRRICDRRARQAEGGPLQVKAAADDKAATDTKKQDDGRHARDAAQTGAGGDGRHGRRRAGAMLDVSFPADKMIDANGIDVSDAGMAAIKILAEATKKESAKVRIRARVSSAAAPKELRSLFRTAGEMNAVRAARVMSSLQTRGRGARAHHHRRRRRQGRGAAARGKKAAAPLRRTGSSSRSSPSSTCAAAGAWRCSRSWPRSTLVARPARGLRLHHRPAHHRSGLPGAALRRRRQQRAAVAAAADAIHGPGGVRSGARPLARRRRRAQPAVLRRLVAVRQRLRRLHARAADRQRRDPRAETEPARHPVHVPGRQERRRARRLRAGAADPLRSGRLLRVRRRRRDRARDPQLRRPGVSRARRFAASCRCRRRSTSSTAPARGRAIR